MTVLAAALRPVLTFVVVTVPRWWWVVSAPRPATVLPGWLARERYEAGKRGDE